jgi:hypothetical protein
MVIARSISDEASHLVAIAGNFTPLSLRGAVVTKQSHPDGYLVFIKEVVKEGQSSSYITKLSHYTLTERAKRTAK